MSTDVYLVLIKDPDGLIILDSIHHHASGRGKTYEKTGANARIRELQRVGIRADLKRVNTGSRLDTRFLVREE